MIILFIKLNEHPKTQQYNKKFRHKITLSIINTPIPNNHSSQIIPKNQIILQTLIIHLE